MGLVCSFVCFLNVVQWHINFSLKSLYFGILVKLNGLETTVIASPSRLLIQMCCLAVLGLEQVRTSRHMKRKCSGACRKNSAKEMRSSDVKKS